ncbi:MAG TPA: PadR family transcriptional regulator [Gaiellales bacterium]|jgi:DNA-binding PadR family transcriptional regulator
MAAPRTPASPLALAVLCLLEVGPLHPYGLQRLIKLWGKDKVVNVGQRATLYKTIQRLHAAGLIAVRSTERDQQFPERTVYELTDEGRSVQHEWLTAMLQTPRNEFPEFPAALSFAMLLAPAEALEVLDRRAAVVRERLQALAGELAEFGHLPRVTLLETEYERAVVAAELAWLDAAVADLREGALTWSHEQLAEVARASLSP